MSAVSKAPPPPPIPSVADIVCEQLLILIGIIAIWNLGLETLFPA